MPDSDLQITFGVDASGLVQGAAQAKAALGGLAPSVKSLGGALAGLADQAARGLKGLADVAGGLAKGPPSAADPGAPLSGAGQAEQSLTAATADGVAQRLAIQQGGDAARLASTRSMLAAALGLEQNHAAQVLSLNAAALARQDAGRQADLARFQREWDKAMRPLVSSFTRGLTKMAEGTRSFGQVLKGLGQQLLAEFVSRVIDPMLERWLAKELGQTAATMAGVATRSAANAAGAAADATATGGAALKDLMSSAAAAAGQAFKAMAGIPIVGPALGASAAAAAFAGVMAFQGMIQSAAGGFDVPAGLDPLTRLHAREMVLPAHLAERVRAMTEAGAASPTINATFHAYGADAAQAVERSQRQWRRHIENLARNNALRGVRRA